MNRALPPGDRGHQSPAPGRASGRREGLCLALADWSWELRTVGNNAEGLATVAPRLAHVRSCGGDWASWPWLGKGRRGIEAGSRKARRGRSRAGQGGGGRCYWLIR